VGEIKRKVGITKRNIRHPNEEMGNFAINEHRRFTAYKAPHWAPAWPLKSYKATFDDSRWWQMED